MIIFGVRASKIGRVDIPYAACEYCGQDDTQEITIFGRYLHIFWIPVLPFGRKAVAECTHCRRTIEEKAFSPELKQLYRTHKSAVKRPWWHWLALWVSGGAIALFIALVLIINLGSDPDPRQALFQADVETLSLNPTMEKDSIAFKIKNVFDSFATEEINPSEFQYLTKVQADKALVIMRIPKLRKVDKEARMEVIQLIELVTDGQADLQGKQLYIGVKGLFTTILIKTPDYEANSRIARESELYDFYGPEAKEGE